MEKILKFLNMSGVRWEVSDLPADTAVKPNTPTVTGQISESASAPQAAPEISAIPAKKPTSGALADDAATLAAAAADVAALCDTIRQFNHPLKGYVKNTVMPRIKPGAKFMFITDCPNKDDDDSGIAMSGKCGEMFDKMISAMGLTDISVSPAIFWRAPGDRKPTDSEIDSARPFLGRAIELAAPEIIVTMGVFSAEMFGLKLPADHGKESDFGGRRLVPVFHPKYLILFPNEKKRVWDALSGLK